MPGANDRQHEEEKSDKQKTRRFGRVRGVAMLLRGALGLGGSDHANIVVLGANHQPVWSRTLLARDDPPADECVRSFIPTATLGVVSVPQNTSRVLRFGVFEVDLSAGELRKSGMRLRLQGQPFQVLALLLEHAGEVVTREQLQQALWPSDTFVDFDHSLNTAINKVREALGDSASNPRYLETLARKGYRFIAPLQPAAPTALRGSANIVPEPAPQAVTLHPERDLPTPRRGLTRALFGLIQVMYLSFYVAALFRLHGVEVVADSFLPPWAAIALVAMVMVTAGVGTLRCYLLSSVAFDYRRLAQKFRKIFVFVLGLDELWALAPFLLAEQIGVGAAFAACAALLYVPFSERTLIRMAYLSVPESG